MTRPRSSILVTAFLLTMAPPSSQGFVSTMPSSSQRTSSVQASSSASNNNNNNNNGNLDDLEEARRSFEASIKPHLTAAISIEPQHQSPPLTASSRRRRSIEMDLINSLRDSNDAIDELVTLWMVERGDAATQQRLRDMEHGVCSDGLIVEEATLRTMMDDYRCPDEWPEPACRLAAVLYYQGRSKESMEWANRVLQIKPWHFEAVQLQILNCLRLKNYSDIWTFARQALPPLNPTTNHAARQRWTDRALRDAQRSLDQAEEAAQLSRDGSSLQGDEQHHMWQ